MESKNLESTTDELKKLGHINNEDVYAFCKFYDRINVLDTAVATTGLFTFRWSTVDYLVAANPSEFKIFNINKKTGEYLNEYLIIAKDQIDKLVCKKYALINVTKRHKINVRVKDMKLKLDLLVGETFRGTNQSREKANLIAMLTTHLVK